MTETYISLRRLENEVLRELSHGQIALGDESLSPIQVSISQFYGIEINDFAVTVAKTALWIAESQMMKETESIVLMRLDFLPLKTNANITEGNALRIDWESVVPKYKLNYIMGNPPFVGYKFQSKEQKEELKNIAGDFDSYGTLDYVSGWYIKAAKFIKGTLCRCAFVSTNSISQGEHVNTLWKPLFAMGIEIIFAYRTFRWNSEAKNIAAVHCVIVGFSYDVKNMVKKLWNESGQVSLVNYINGYLLDAPNIFIEKRSKPWDATTPVATKGNAAMDGGFLTISAKEREDILLREPALNSVIRRHMSADDFLNAKENYCFWLKGASPHLIGTSKELQKRIQAVKDYRNGSNRAATKKMAEYPTLFAEVRQPDTNYIMLPVVSSERRKYIPIAFLTPDIINSYASISIPNATLYHFGTLCSNVHNAWMRAVCGRLEMRYRYSTTIVYNNFPWPEPTDAQKAKIEQTAQAILDARALYPDSSLADLYDELTMPPELRTAHQQNDRAVMQAYGFSVRDTTESACVAELMKMYQKKVEQTAK
ncbi:MAG: class I SAM-dependent DNA methyltransferase [Oscillospiraceae bacterium]|nr:class I SAM-dependent DNA methyltransferase [Oscillospiraceae bacterium]